MSSPYYFSSYWDPHQSKSKSSRNYSSSRKSETTTTPSPRVVSIPVHFVESEQKRSDSAAAAALKIQKVFRGFLVRKSIQKIVCIRNQVQETEMRLSRKEGVELIAKDPKERLKVNETLMSLLFKLDSVRGIDSGVRDFRRGVIKKAIALQERLDALPPQEEEVREEDDSTTADANDGQAVAVAEEEEDNNNEDPPNSNCYDEMSIDHNPQHNRQEEDVKEIVEDCSNTLNCFQVADEKMVQGGDCEINDCKEEEETVTVEGGGGGITMKDEDNSNNKEEEDNMKTMMRMMRELIEKNELQTRMINSLNHRVGQLEKAFLCDRLRRSNNKKKKLQQQQQQQDGKHPSS